VSRHESDLHGTEQQCCGNLHRYPLWQIDYSPRYSILPCLGSPR
jgi:hypothetical protein